MLYPTKEKPCQLSPRREKSQISPFNLPPNVFSSGRPNNEGPPFKIKLPHHSSWFYLKADTYSHIWGKRPQGQQVTLEKGRPLSLSLSSGLTTFFSLCVCAHVSKISLVAVRANTCMVFCTNRGQFLFYLQLISLAISPFVS